jgi:Glucosamine 6-phosphate synthetase, contains amidotransferase and phosphosugar isomerase domains
MKKGLAPTHAVAATLPQLKGAFALAFLFEGEDDLLIGARRGSPLAVGYGEGEMFLGSDAIALRRSPIRSATWRTATGSWYTVRAPKCTTRPAASLRAR